MASGGSLSFDSGFERIPHTPDSPYARLHAALAPAPPSRARNARISKDGRHLKSGLFGAALNLNNFGCNTGHDAYDMQKCTYGQCVNANGAVPLNVLYRAVSDYAEKVREFLDHAMGLTGLTASGLAKRAQISPSTITRFLNNPEFKFVPKPTTLAKIAYVSGLDLPDDLAIPPSGRPEGTELPLIGPIQAGAWLALDDIGQDEPATYPAVADRRFPHAPQWLREVRGDSMNAKGISVGDLVHMVDIGAAGININTGMIVEVTRTRLGGALREVTLKEVEIVPGGVLLWPRSTNPVWKEPVVLGDGTNDDIEVKITGLLLAKITRF